MPVSVPMPMPSVPAPPSAHAHPPTITATPHTMTWSPSPPPSHPSKAPATPESQKNVSSPQAPPTPSLSPGPNPSSKSMGATPIIKGPGNPTTQPHPQPASKSAKPASKQNRITKVDKPAQEVRGPTTKASISISTFTQVFKPRPSMPGAFPGPEMDVDWVMVDQGPAEIQGGNWLKRLFRRPS
ncbi:hypothetical protein EI94DRAFT_99234 [Lactarius quietus]|nr:hypothetical protein EI94DRAFT_99234 [Lactarius quietus]